MDVKKLKQLLRDYDSGKISSAERWIVDLWYASFSREKQHIPLLDDEQQKEAMRNRIWKQLPTHEPGITFLQQYKRLLYTLGAAAMLLLIGVWAYRKEAMSVIEKESTELQARFRSQTGERERKLLMLPDSSQVWLNANSTIEVDVNYGNHARHVHLKGEAFFDVTPNSERPFIVETANLQIEVLGTAFNVSNYPTLPRAHVTVDHGTVAVRDQNKKLLKKLIHDESLSYTITDRQFSVRSVVEVGSWREGRVVLEQATFDELAQALSNVYGVHLRTERRGHKSYSYNLDVHAGRSLEQTMTIIARMHRLKYRRQKDEIILY